MTHTIYALLVGIDQYQSPRIPPLQGCVNDITQMETFLRGRVAGSEYDLQISTLKNAAATRQAIIDQFRTHLCQAGNDDVALFYYSGHGSQERTSREFWQLEPDHLDETLVCYDSRTPGHYDLADKELAKLIAEVANRDSHIVIILDSCHSGSGTRNITTGTVRRIPTYDEPRPLDSFILTPEEAHALSGARALTETKSDWIDLPLGKHILMAACRDYESAKELPLGGQHRGVFSYFLMETLHGASRTLTYRDLFKRVETRVQQSMQDQSPQIETIDNSYLHQPFLGGAVSQSTYFTLNYQKELGWVIDGGAVHGLPPITDEETITLAFFPFDSTPDELQNLAVSIGTARVTERLPQLSRVTVTKRDGKALDPQQVYKAVVTGVPVPRLGVVIEGDVAAVQLARQALLTSSTGQKPSLYVREMQQLAEAKLRLLAQNNTYQITRATGGSSLTTDIADYSEFTARQVILRLEHIARWITIAELDNKTSRLSAGAVQMEFHRVVGPPLARTAGSELTEPYVGSELRLEYEKRQGKWEAPLYKISVKNTSTETLYCALVQLTETYGVQTDLWLGRGVRLEPGQQTWAHHGKRLKAEVSDELSRQGITESKDLFKLIVSTADFDATLLDQGDLDVPYFPKSTRGVQRNMLNRLLTRVQTRTSVADDDDTYIDWMTSEVTLTAVRPLDGVFIPGSGDQPVSLNQSVQIEPHAGLKARAHLITVAQTGRDLGNLLFPSVLRDAPEVAQLFQFVGQRGNDPGLSGLELFDVTDHTVVTAEQPLILQVDTAPQGLRGALLAEDEHILPLGYDSEGEFFLPLGRALRGDNHIRIELQRLPSPAPLPVIGDRSLTGSIRIFFLKMLSKSVGLDYEYPLLATTSVTDDGVVTYTKELAEVKTRVAAAQRILLYIHGIIGDTLGMATSSRCLHLQVEPVPPRLADRYDLILTFDYENLNTSIKKTARDLKQRLLMVGLEAGQKKQLDIVAHSMGGLVARWFIEHEGGNEVVRRLVMLGTPNNGSPWPKLENMATTLLAIALNNLMVLPWPAHLLSYLVRMIEKVDVTLDEMIPGSSLLEELSQSDDPHLPYFIIAGNTSISPVAMQPDVQGSRFERLMRRLFPKNLLYQVAGLPFFGRPNDIAVAVESIEYVPGNRSPQPAIRDVACDHLSYFTTEMGLRTLAEVLD